MCWQCQQIDREINHYGGLSVRITERASAKSLDILIANLEAEKRQLHAAESTRSADTAPPR